MALALAPADCSLPNQTADMTEIGAIGRLETLQQIKSFTSSAHTHTHTHPRLTVFLRSRSCIASTTTKLWTIIMDDKTERALWKQLSVRHGVRNIPGSVMLDRGK